jgi:hypothetical protein
VCVCVCVRVLYYMRVVNNPCMHITTHIFNILPPHTYIHTHTHTPTHTLKHTHTQDTAWERELKLKVLEIYNSKLDARAERKKFILERGLLERKQEKRPKEEREIYNNMRVFARFHRYAYTE